MSLADTFRAEWSALVRAVYENPNLDWNQIAAACGKSPQSLKTKILAIRYAKDTGCPQKDVESDGETLVLKAVELKRREGREKAHRIQIPASLVHRYEALEERMNHLGIKTRESQWMLLESIVSGMNDAELLECWNGFSPTKEDNRAARS